MEKNQKIKSFNAPDPRQQCRTIIAAGGRIWQSIFNHSQKL